MKEDFIFSRQVVLDVEIVAEQDDPVKTGRWRLPHDEMAFENRGHTPQAAECL